MLLSASWSQGSAALPELSARELATLAGVCAGDSVQVRPGTVFRNRNKILLYDTAGHISEFTGALPGGIQARDVNSAGLLFCLEAVDLELEECSFPPFFTVPRIQPGFEVSAYSLAVSGSSKVSGFIAGEAPPACNAAGTIDASVSSLRGSPPTATEVLDFIDGLSLSAADADGDGLDAVEEFLLDSDPQDRDSPALQATLRLNGGQVNGSQENGGSNLSLFEGESFDLALNVFPGPALGQPVDYYLTADTNAGLFSYIHPLGFKAVADPEMALSAKLTKLFNFNLLRIPESNAGDYRLNLEIRRNGELLLEDQATVTVLPDPCREPRSLPFSLQAEWQAECPASHSPVAGDLARYYPFALAEQATVTFELDAGGQPGQLFLLAGAGRNGSLIQAGELSGTHSTMRLELDAGRYTLEVASNSTASNKTGAFTLEARLVALAWQFTDVTQSAGFDYVHGFSAPAGGISLDRQRMVAGVAAGDFDRDGWVDLYITRGTIGPNLLFRNRGDGSFAEVGAAAGVALNGAVGSGASFADYDGDGWLDLFVGGINGTIFQSRLLRNRQDGSFEDVTAEAGLDGAIINSFSTTFGDYDLDGDLDLYLSDWGANKPGRHLWRNNGNGTFSNVTMAAGIPDGLMQDFTGNFADIDNDGWPDLLIAADFGSSQVFLNQRNGSFSVSTTDAISDENGMGAAVGDYDNDGDLDWFVSSIFDPNGPPPEQSTVSWGASGNRLYRNQGDGRFEDVTEAAGVRIGGWGWGSCMADFNNDGHLDIFHVNGFSTNEKLFTAPFEADRSRLFISNQDGSFSERSVELGLVDQGQGRGVVCFDHDGDGDVDIFVANNGQSPRLYRNDGGNDGHFLHVRVRGERANTEAIGARIYVSVDGVTQMRELSAGSNYLSQNPAEVYFGLGQAGKVDEVRVLWPGDGRAPGREKILTDVPVNQLLIIQ
ncbi:MAG: CRTAC1 family protein [Pseudomonadales bacterium]|nr:CRTAC1 family protein [Pseudomonadales bacterium]